MKNADLNKKVHKDSPKLNELCAETLDFSELGKITGGNTPAKETGCKGVFNGHCGGGTKEE